MVYAPNLIKAELPTVEEIIDRLADAGIGIDTPSPAPSGVAPSSTFPVEVLFSSAKTGGSDNWASPRDLVAQLDSVWHFDLDAAADETNHICPFYLGPGSELGEDALTVDWGPIRAPLDSPERPTNVFLNMPYSMTKKFMYKAHAEAKAGRANVVCLVAARTDVLYFHDLCWDAFVGAPRPGVRINFLKGRLRFGESKNSAPFPSALITFFAGQVR